MENMRKWVLEIVEGYRSFNVFWPEKIVEGKGGEEQDPVGIGEEIGFCEFSFSFNFKELFKIRVNFGDLRG